METNKEIINALQIAIYAINCENTNEYADEVSKLIEQYAQSKVDLAVKEHEQNMIETSDYFYKAIDGYKQEADSLKNHIESLRTQNEEAYKEIFANRERLKQK